MSSNEWYTPADYIDAAYSVMGVIDCDPASCDEAQEVVAARQYFTQERSGLDAEWHGNVFLNPPYSRDLVRGFITKLREEWQLNHVIQAIVLLNSGTETQHYQGVLDIASAFCMPQGRIKFSKPGGEIGDSPNKGQTLFYVGLEPHRFTREFSKFGIARMMI